MLSNYAVDVLLMEAGVFVLILWIFAWTYYYYAGLSKLAWLVFGSATALSFLALTLMGRGINFFTALLALVYGIVIAIVLIFLRLCVDSKKVRGQ